MVTFRCTQLVGKARCEPGWAWSPNSPLTEFDLWYAVEGKGQMIINGESYPIGKGSCFLIRPGDRVKATQEPEHRLTVFFVHFMVQEDDHDLIFPGRHVRFEDTTVPEMCLQRIVDLRLREEPQKDEECDLLIRLVILHMVRQENAAQSPVSSMHKQLIHKVMDELADHSGKAVTVTGLAAAVHVSPRYMSQLFKKYTGYSLKEYITRVRMERARFLLAETSMNINEVSSALGFTDVYHFSKMFKARYGAPPSRYRYKGRSAQSHFGHSRPTQPTK